MSQLGLIIKNEYLTEIRSKSFWVATLVTPIIMGAFSIFMGYIMAQSETTSKIANPTAPDPNEMTGAQAAGMVAGVVLALFLMIYGSQIFAKVKKEKTNRIMEVMATCVTGRTMMLGKVISVGLVGLTQLLAWGVILFFILAGVIFIFNIDIPFDILKDPRVINAIIYTILFFVGGYIFYGALYAAVGAMSDKDNENQAYMTVLTFLLLGSFYIGMYASTHATSALSIFCAFFPFTAPCVGAVIAIGGDSPLWISLLSIIVLYVFAWIGISFAGKLYTSALLLKGKKLTPGDILTFLRSK